MRTRRSRMPKPATRLALTYLGAFTDSYRSRTAPDEGAADILRLSGLSSDADRSVRISRRDGDPDRQMRLKTYRKGGLIALSDAVPVLENFGFRVLEERPSALSHELGYIHDFSVEIGAEADVDAILSRVPEIERAISHVLCGISEDD